MMAKTTSNKCRFEAYELQVITRACLMTFKCNNVPTTPSFYSVEFDSLLSFTTGNGEDDNLIDTDSFYITFTTSYAIVILGIIDVLFCESSLAKTSGFIFVEM